MNQHQVRATIQGGFWKSFQDLVRHEVIPYQWRALNDQIPGAPPSHCIENFKIAAGRNSGSYEGMVFQDSDVSKWLEAAGHALGDESPANEEIGSWVESVIDLIAEAQRPDGYVNTYFTVKEPDRHWKNLREAHQLYCAGHLIEAGVAVNRSTGNQKILEVIRRLADHIDAVFGSAAGKLKGYAGHEEIELSLVKLYRLTGEKRYLDLAKYFIDERGRSPNFFEEEKRSPDYTAIWDFRNLEYFQAHVPVRQQSDAVGHAVRAMYLYTAMADIAFETSDNELADSCDRLWESTTSRRMYVTGGIGSSHELEAFTFDFDLPNDTAYAETCAAIGLFFFSYRMACLRNHARYVDVMERALYNGVLSGLALDGHAYFYVNPLEVVPEACNHNPTYGHVKVQRQPWYECACCPPNIARTIASIGEYSYHVSEETLYADLFHEGTIELSLGGKAIAFRQTTEYPWRGHIAFEYRGATPARFTFAVRIPGWCGRADFSMGGHRLEIEELAKNGYVHIDREWRPGDLLEVDLSMAIERVYADPRVRADWGKVAVQRGPVVYCLEEVDNGPFLNTMVLPAEAELGEERRSDFLGGVVAVRGMGRVWDQSSQSALYETNRKDPVMRDRELLFVPYYAWANRGLGEMTVWVNEQRIK